MTVNPDLQRERDGATFEIIQLTYFLDDGKYNTERRRYIENIAKNDPEMQNAPSSTSQSQEEDYTEGMRKMKIFLQRQKELDIVDPQDLATYNRAMFPNEMRPDGIHCKVFLPNIQRQMSDEQINKWLPLAQSYKVIGTYAQTELGHGTNIRGLETKASYDPDTEEFIIHSPTLSSAKFWPAGLGRMCNHAIVMAILHVGGKNRGMHQFMVQLRDLDTHMPCKGVQLGDIGPKIGASSIGNGYAMFNHVRIPRENMLMRYTKVSPSGEYESVGAAKMSYFTMVYLRTTIVRDPAAVSLSQAVTIAVRYSAVRRQSEMKPSEIEPQILDYQTQQYKLLPALATAYAFQFVSKYINKLFNDVEKDVRLNNFERLPELHAMAAGLKSFCTYTSCELIETLRLACGGHGYSRASGLPKIYTLTMPSCTYEGENTVLYLQTARYLMKVYEQIQRGNSEQFAGTTLEYVWKQLPTSSALTEQLELDLLLQAYQYRAKYRISIAAAGISGHMDADKDRIDATQLSTVKLVKAAEAHSQLCVLEAFKFALNEGSASIKPVLTRLYRLYAAHGIVENSGDFVVNGYLSSQQISSLDVAIFNLLGNIRTDAVALVDAFDYPDFILCSSLGTYDGNVYDNIMEFAKQSTLNKTEVHETFHKYIKPMRASLSSKI